MEVGDLISNQILFRVIRFLSALVEKGTVGSQLCHGPKTVVAVNVLYRGCLGPRGKMLGHMTRGY